ncbi:dipeptidase [Novosphingobium sp. MD-1]|uniref:dipeptidase n=1 Tax=Novosphingobium sp. MD-1 TaxID=1630648 RepID=UPI001F202E70|nr:dipeptidase [Novosphingobium sp. MD-1]
MFHIPPGRSIKERDFLMRKRAIILGAAALVASSVVFARNGAPMPSAHRDAIVLDTHIDTPALLHVVGWSIMDRHSLSVDGTQVDLPRMRDGGLDGGFFVVFTEQGPRTPTGYTVARDEALMRTIEIRDMVARHHEAFQLATRADDAEKIVKSGKRAVFMSMENSYPIGQDLSLMRTFRALGVTMMGPVHVGNNDLADSSNPDNGPEWHGLSPLGRQWVAEANRLGILIDASHASPEALDDILALSNAPIILSHSSLKSLADNPRNIDDTRLRALAAKRGVIQINAVSSHLGVPNSPGRAPARTLLGQPAATIAELRAQRATVLKIERENPAPRADLDHLVAQIRHAVALVGIDHVGLSGDFDGGGGIDGFDEASDYPKISQRLLAAGFTAEDLRKFWGGNVLRVLREAQARAEPSAVAGM